MCELYERIKINRISDLAESLAVVAAALVIIISAVLFVWLLWRGFINWLSGLTLAISMLSAFTVLAYSVSLKRNGVAWILLITALVPTVFGLVWVLYLVPAILLTLAVLLSLLSRRSLN